MRLGKRLEAQRGLTLVEVLVVIVMVAILVTVAIHLAFADGADRAYDSRAKQHLGVALKELKSQHAINKESYPQNEDELADRMERSVRGGIEFHGYGGGSSPSESDYDISVSVEDPQMASLCVRSETGRTFCARRDELALLEISDSPYVDAGASDRLLSYCAAPDEEEARACLSFRDFPGDEQDPGPGGGDEQEGEEPPEGPGPGDGPGADPDPDEGDGPSPQDPGGSEGDEGSVDPPAPPAPEPDRFRLNVYLVGDGEGRVTGPGINCPGDCSQMFDEGTEVQLRVEVSGDNSFVGWSDDCSGRTQTCTVVMDQDRVVTAGVLAPSVYEQEFSAKGDVLSLGNFSMSSNAKIIGSVHAGGALSMSSNATICGNARYGTTLSKHSNAKIDCGGQLAQAPLSLPFVDQGIVSQQNNNRLPVDGGKWNPQTRTLQLSSNSYYLIPSGVYSFCRIALNSNSRVLIPEGGDVTIYFDTPENCGLAPNSVQLTFNSNSEVVNADATITAPEYNSGTKLRLLFAGSPWTSTRVVLNSNANLPEQCRVNLVLYAPRTDITMNSNATFCGDVAGKTMNVSSNAHIRSN